MSKSLPERPNLDHLRKQAKELLSAYRSGDLQAADRFKENLPSFGKGTPALHDAQSVVAREYGFESWQKLVAHVEEVLARGGITSEVADNFIHAATSGRTGLIRRMLNLYPGLPTYNKVTRLVCGEAVEADPNEKLPPLDWAPLEYVCWSSVHQVQPEAYDKLERSARALLDEGGDPNTSHLFGEAPLPVLYGASCESGHVGITKLLLDAGANPDDGESVYHCAQKNRRDMLALLVAAGADISSRHEHWGNTPLFFNAGHRKSDPGAADALLGCEWLLQHGADPNVRSTDRELTPLYQACMSGNTPFVLLLLKFGADPNLVDRNGRTPYTVALLTANEEAQAALLRAGAKSELTEVDQYLVSCANGCPTGSAPPLGPFERGLLTKLAELGKTEAVRAVMDSGFDVATTGEAGATPLHFAAFCGWAATVRLLLERNAPIDVRDDCYHATPLGWALEGKVWHTNPDGDYPALIRDLLAAGADAEEIKRYADSGEFEAEKLADVLAIL